MPAVTSSRGMAVPQRVGGRVVMSCDKAQHYIEVTSQLKVWIYQLACQLTASNI